MVKEQIVISVHLKTRVQPADHRRRIVEIHIRQHALAQHLSHRHRVHRRAGPMARHVQQEQREMPLVEHLVAERVAADPRTGLVEPVGAHRPVIDRLRQDRGHVLAGLAPFLLHGIGVGGLILIAAVVAQAIRADADVRAVFQRGGLGQSRAVDEGAVGGREVGEAQPTVQQLQPAMPAGDGVAFQDQIGGRISANDRRQRMQRKALRWRVFVKQQQQMDRIVGPGGLTRARRLLE